ncbi:MAG: hypothetical protein MUE97_02930 [Phycisphaerales bacterium]|jgi:hypothetical protein|nr:hypothetical protein [Phycisphaerales bacterium]
MARTGEHYIPRPDGGFDAWAGQYVAAVQNFYAQQGWKTDDLQPLLDAWQAWLRAYPQHVAAQAAAEAATQEKVAARRGLEAQVRTLTGLLQNLPVVTNAVRADLGITVRSGTRTAGSTPTSRPMAIVQPTGRLTHELRLVDEATPTKRARPRGVQRAEVFVAFTAPTAPAPSDPGAYRYLQSVSDGTATLAFDAPRAGQQAHYLARWVTPRGAVGPWSETASATVAA